MTQLVLASVSQRSLRATVANATASGLVVMLLSPALCTASSPTKAVQLEDLEDNEATNIDAIPEEYENLYELLKPIPVDFEEVADGAVIAHFREADLAFTGNDKHDAQENLLPWILDIFDDLTTAGSSDVWGNSRHADPRTEPAPPTSAMITKREAEALATKLESQPRAGGNHMKVHVYVDGIWEKTFGFSHDAKKTNPHIAKHLGISRTDAQELARCHKSKDWYFDLLRQKRYGNT